MYFLEEFHGHFTEESSMSRWKSFSLGHHETIPPYVLELFQPEDEVLREIRERSKAAGLPDIQVGGMDARHLEVLTRMVGATKAVEIGTLGGYSGVAILKGLRPGGTLDTFEFSPKHAAIAVESFRKAGFGDQAHVHVGPALEKLAAIEKKGPFDVVFIDANKSDYPRYLDWAATHLRSGGIVIGDNTFAFGHLADEPREDHPEKTAVIAMQAFNTKLARDPRFRATILPTGEGLTVGVKL